MTALPLLLPYQAAWVSDPARVKMFVKSRRIGISWATSAEAVLDASKRGSEGGQHVWYVAQTEDDCAQFMRDARMWAGVFGQAVEAITTTTDQVQYLHDPKDTNPTQVSLHRFASGFAIHALSRRPARLHGKEGHAILDEGALSEDPEGFLEAVMAYLVWGRGKVSIISTESGGTECAFHQWRLDVESGRRPWSLHVVDIHQAIDQGLYERIALKAGWEIDPTKSRAEAAAEWLAELRKLNAHHWDSQFLCLADGAGDVYLDRHAVEGCMVEGAPVLRFTAPRDFVDKPQHIRNAVIDTWIDRKLRPAIAKLDKTRVHAMGADYGRSGDITAIAPIALNLKGRVIPFMVELRNTPNDCQLRVYKALMNELPRRGKCVIDAGGQGSGLAETLRQWYGSDVVRIGIGVGKHRPAKKRPPGSLFYSEILPPLKASIQARELLLPNDYDVLTDLMGLKMVDGMPRVPPVRTKGKTDGKQRHCDAAVAIALAEHAAMLGVSDWSSFEAERVDDRWAM